MKGLTMRFTDCKCGQPHEVPIDEFGRFEGTLPCTKPGEVVQIQVDRETMKQLREKRVH
jgi:hypothetical protein